MTVYEASCDGCGEILRPLEGDELYRLKTGDYCEECVGYDDLTVEEYEGEDDA